MKNSVVNLDREQTIARARGYFQKASGMGTKNPAHIAMLLEGEEVLKGSKGTILIDAVLSSFEKWPAAHGLDDRFALQEEDLALGEITVHCKCFEQIPMADIRRVYVYFLTVGEVNTSSEKAVDQLFADTWGTALVDGARDMVRETILRAVREEDLQGYQLSQSFGPGFFGMDMSELQKLFRVADGTKIGISLNSVGALHPAKSCGGLFFLLKEECQLPDLDCRDCIGNQQGCQYCRI